MNASQRVVLTLWSAAIAGLVGGYIAQHLHVVYGVERTEAFFIAGSAGYLGATVLDLFVCYMRQK